MITTRRQFQKRTKHHQGIDMTHFNSKLTQTFASGATAMAILAGVGMTAAPQAEAAQLTCTASSPCVLSDLLGGNFFVTGDKKFADFIYFDTENAPTAGNITVFGEQTKKDIGIVFNGMFTAQPDEGVEAFLSHTVEILNPNKTFTTIGLSMEAEGFFAGITETVFNPANPLPVPVAQLDVDTDIPPETLFDSEDISSLKLNKIRAEKDIELFGFDGETSRIFSLRQSYAQDIPEPTAMLGLFAVGGLGAALKRKQGK